MGRRELSRGVGRGWLALADFGESRLETGIVRRVVGAAVAAGDDHGYDFAPGFGPLRQGPATVNSWSSGWAWMLMARLGINSGSLILISSNKTDFARNADIRSFEGFGCLNLMIVVHNGKELSLRRHGGLQIF